MNWSTRAAAISRSWFSRSAVVDQLVQRRIAELLPPARVGDVGRLRVVDAPCAGRLDRRALVVRPDGAAGAAASAASDAARACASQSPSRFACGAAAGARAAVRRAGAAFLPREASRSSLSSIQKNSGAKKIATTVEARMPPITPVPIARRLFAPGTGGDRERHAAQAEGERGHHDGAQAQARRLDRRLAHRHAVAHALDGELADQDRVLRRQADQRHQADLEVHVVLQPAHPGEQQRAEDRERHRQHHRDRQRPLLELRGEQQEHDDQAGDEGDRRGAARLLLLQRLAGPGVGEVAGQRLARHRLHRRERLARAVARRPGRR